MNTNNKNKHWTAGIPDIKEKKIFLLLRKENFLTKVKIYQTKGRKSAYFHPSKKPKLI